MGSRKRDRSWPPADAVAPLTAPVTDNHTHLPVAADAGGPGSEAPLSAAELVERAAAVGVTRVVTSACEVTTWQESLALPRQLPGVRVALAVHPNEAVLHAGVRETGPDGLEPRAQEHHAEPLEEVMVRLEETLRANADVVVAVGESGLDFFRTGEKGAVAQREAFRAHIALAKDLDLPLEIHDRDAHAACAEHSWYASIAGPLTYPANDTLREAVAALPEALLLVETDAPYLPPKRWRGRPNASYLLGDTVRFLAEQRGLSEEDLCRRLQATTETIYGTW